MANKDRPTGLKPVRHLNGNPWNGNFNMYRKTATENFFIGTPVTLAGSADDSGKYPTVVLAGAASAILGSVVGFSNTPYLTADVTDLDKDYSISTEDVYVAVADDPDLVFEIQEDSSTALTIAAVGLNADLTAESGSTTTGKSSVEIDCATEATTSTLEVKILKLVNREDNALGDYAKWEVMINVHCYGQGVGAAGL